MTTDSKIEWTDHTFSPWLGCTPLSAACDHCYAAALARRYGWPAYKAGEPRRLTGPSSWKMPHRWQKKAKANGVRLRVFPSLCDPFDKEVPGRWRNDLFRLIEETPDLVWLLLTKRPKLAREWFEAWGTPPANVALGVTAENQSMADLRIPELLAIPKVFLRFLSIEPMLGPIDLTNIRVRLAGESYMTRSALQARDSLDKGSPEHAIDWVIAGGESGGGARPSHPDWFGALRDQCQTAGTAFFFKQWGDWTPISRIEAAAGVKSHDISGAHMIRVGKKEAGAALEGRTWRELPAQLRAAT